MRQTAQAEPEGSCALFALGAAISLILVPALAMIMFQDTSEAPPATLAYIPLGLPILVAVGLWLWRPVLRSFSRGMVVGVVLYFLWGSCGVFFLIDKG